MVRSARRCVVPGWRSVLRCGDINPRWLCIVWIGRHVGVAPAARDRLVGSERWSCCAGGTVFGFLPGRSGASGRRALVRLRLNLMIDSPELEAAIWSIADGRGSADDLARLHADERASLVVLDRLIIDVEDDLASARSLVGDERDQVVADLAETLDGLRGTVARLRRPITPVDARAATGRADRSATRSSRARWSSRPRGRRGRSWCGHLVEARRRSRTTICRPGWKRSADHRWVGCSIRASSSLAACEPTRSPSR